MSAILIQSHRAPSSPLDMSECSSAVHLVLVLFLSVIEKHMAP